MMGVGVGVGVDVGVRKGCIPLKIKPHPTLQRADMHNFTGTRTHAHSE